MLEGEGNVCSFVNSFRTSANGWGRPAIPTLFGPFRSCIYPSIFRSRSVKKAIVRAAASILDRIWVSSVIKP